MLSAATAPDLPPKALAILDAAESLFVRFGYRKTSVDDVAREAGIAKGTVYLYFAGKEPLFRAMLSRVNAQTVATAQAAAGRSAPFSERLQGVLQAFYGDLYDRFGSSGYRQELGEVWGSLGRDLADELRQQRSQLLETLLLQAEATGDIVLATRGLQASALAETIACAALGAKTSVYAQPDGSSLAQRLQSVAQVFSTMLASESR